MDKVSNVLNTAPTSYHFHRKALNYEHNGKRGNWGRYVPRGDVTDTILGDSLRMGQEESVHPDTLLKEIDEFFFDAKPPERTHFMFNIGRESGGSAHSLLGCVELHHGRGKATYKLSVLNNTDSNEDAILKSLKRHFNPSHKFYYKIIYTTRILNTGTEHAPDEVKKIETEFDITYHDRQGYCIVWSSFLPYMMMLHGFNHFETFCDALRTISGLDEQRCARRLFMIRGFYEAFCAEDAEQIDFVTVYDFATRPDEPVDPGPLASPFGSLASPFAATPGYGRAEELARKLVVGLGTIKSEYDSTFADNAQGTELVRSGWTKDEIELESWERELGMAWQKKMHQDMATAYDKWWKTTEPNNRMGLPQTPQKEYAFYGWGGVDANFNVELHAFDKDRPDLFEMRAWHKFLFDPNPVPDIELHDIKSDHPGIRLRAIVHLTVACHKLDSPQKIARRIFGPLVPKQHLIAQGGIGVLSVWLGIRRDLLISRDESNFYGTLTYAFDGMVQDQLQIIYDAAIVLFRDFVSSTNTMREVYLANPNDEMRILSQKLRTAALQGGPLEFELAQDASKQLKYTKAEFKTTTDTLNRHVARQPLPACAPYGIHAIRRTRLQDGTTGPLVIEYNAQACHDPNMYINPLTTPLAQHGRDDSEDDEDSHSLAHIEDVHKENTTNNKKRHKHFTFSQTPSSASPSPFFGGVPPVPTRSPFSAHGFGPPPHVDPGINTFQSPFSQW